MKLLRNLSLLLVVGMLFTSLIGCGKKDDDDDTSSGSVVSSVESGGEKVVSGIESEVSKIESGTESNLESMMSNGHVSDETKSNEGSLESDLLTTNAVPVDIDFSKFDSLENEKKGWGQGVDVDEQNRPLSCTQFGQKYGKYGAFFINDLENVNSKNVYFTFDEGYENGYTAQILDILKEKKCPAVFFVTMPYVKENPDLIKRMIAEGHIVGNHTVNHPSMPTITSEKAAQEIMVLHQYMEENFNYTMSLFRPPMGEWSEKSLALTQALGYNSIFWSFAYKDWETDNQPESASALNKITSSTHNGEILLLHAVSSTNTGILGEVIDEIRNKGFITAKMG